jgi:hypothetical protein
MEAKSYAAAILLSIADSHENAVVDRPIFSVDELAWAAPLVEVSDQALRGMSAPHQSRPFPIASHAGTKRMIFTTSSETMAAISSGGFKSSAGQSAILVVLAAISGESNEYGSGRTDSREMPQSCRVTARSA